MSDSVTVILPSYNPDQKLLDVVDGLLHRGFHDIVVVNDGSDEAHLAPFQTLSAYPDCTLLTHEVNRGKGCALKTAFSYCLKHRPEAAGVITVDGDNQHHPEDIAHCVSAMLAAKNQVILGVRDFSQADVPPRSRFGNTMTKTVFRLFCGIRISDTQTGLRAIPACYLKDMLEIDGERYEYETNMLLEMKARNIPFCEVPIRTIYIEENSSSHFHPIRDSLKIYRIIFKFALSSGASAILDLTAFWIFVALLGKLLPAQLTWFGHAVSASTASIGLATLFARILSSLANYKLNERLVFASASRGTFFRYYALCVIQLCVSAVLVSLLSSLFSSGSFLKTVLKAAVDTLLFFLSFRIQKEWVFRRDKATN